MRPLRTHRSLLAACLLLLACLAAPATAGAAECEGRTLEQPFLPWLDQATYFLAPDGDFTEGAAGWRLEGATVVEENEPYWVHGGDTPAAVRLSDGASATSPWLCAGLLDPTLRLFARSAGDPRGSLRVEVLFTDAQGDVQALSIGAVSGEPAGDWAPTPALPVVANVLPDTPLAFRFTADGINSAWVIDDVYVDPYVKG
jgi:hypothetical protein